MKIKIKCSFQRFILYYLYKSLNMHEIFNNFNLNWFTSIYTTDIEIKKSNDNVREKGALALGPLPISIKIEWQMTCICIVAITNTSMYVCVCVCVVV